MPKQPNGRRGKKPPAPSVKVSLHKLGIAEVDTAPYRSSPLTKVAYRSHINVGENSEILRCGSISNHGSRC
jgi:hypothetical protein